MTDVELTEFLNICECEREIYGDDRECEICGQKHEQDILDCLRGETLKSLKDKI